MNVLNEWLRAVQHILTHSFVKRNILELYIGFLPFCFIVILQVSITSVSILIETHAINLRWTVLWWKVIRTTEIGFPLIVESNDISFAFALAPVDTASVELKKSCNRHQPIRTNMPFSKPIRKKTENNRVWLSHFSRA